MKSTNTVVTKLFAMYIFKLSFPRERRGSQCSADAELERRDDRLGDEREQTWLTLFCRLYCLLGHCL